MAADDPLIGKQLGDYTIQSLLGRGGMSRVYRGYDANLDRYAAVKVISGDFATTTEEEYTRRFQTEARAIARLRHPNIVGVYQFGRSEGIYYMAQVFLEGQDLRTLLKGYAERHQRLPLDQVMRIIRDITSALDYAHEQGVIHRDIKPSNIMLERKTGRAILMDFGLALSVHEGTLGDTFGSAHYIAPEQAISSAKAVPQSDLYALGIVLYEMLTGTVPFDDPSVMSVALKHLNELPPPPSLYNPELSPQVEAVILKVLDKDPARRYPTGYAFYEALQRALSSTAQLTAGAPPAEAPPIPAADLWSPRATPIVPPAPLPARPPTPPPVRLTPPPPTPEQGLAGRFRRRKEEKEVAAALESGDGLSIDDDTLNKLLQEYVDPRDLGLVGEGAPGLTPPPQRIAPGRISRLPRARPRRRRRSRPAVLILLVLLLLIAVGALWIVLRRDGADQTGTLQGSAPTLTPTAAGPPLAIAQTGTAAVAMLQTASATAAAALLPVTSTPTPDATPSPLPPSLTPTAAAPSPVPASATTLPSATLPAATATVTATSTVPPSTPTLTATPPPTQAPASTATPARSATLLLSATPTAAPLPSATPLAIGPAPSATVTRLPRTPNVRLVYSSEGDLQGRFSLTNLGIATLNISALVFERQRPDGTWLRYEAASWARPDINGTPDTMPGRSCLQLVTTNGTPDSAADGACARYLGFYRTNVTSRYFWISAEPGAAFTVRDAAQGLTLATCAIDAGRCEFYLGAEGEAATPLPPSPTPGGVPPDQAALRLIYDVNGFLIVNLTGQTLDISGLIFEQGGGVPRQFAAREWERPDIETPPSAMEPGGCYQLVPAEGTQTVPAETLCARLLGWFRTSVTGRYFWLSPVPEAIFSVRQADSAEVLAICPVGEGTCNVPLPGVGSGD